MEPDFNNERLKNLINNDEDPLKDYPMEDQELDYEELEVLPPNPLSSAVERLNAATIKGLPLGAEDTIRSGRDLIRKQTQEAKQVSAAIGALFTNLNKRYGFDIQWDPESFSANLESIMSSTNQRALELYISEGYSKVRVVLYQQFLSSIVALASKVLDPAYLMSNSLSFEDQMTTIEKLFGFIEQMNSIHDQVYIENTGEKLEHLSEDSDSSSEFSLQDPNVRAYLNAFRQSFNQNKDNSSKQE